MHKIMNLKELNLQKKQNKAISIDPSEHFTDTTSFSHYVTYDFHKLINKNSKKQNKDNFSDLQIYITYKVILIKLNNSLVNET